LCAWTRPPSRWLLCCSNQGKGGHDVQSIDWRQGCRAPAERGRRHRDRPCHRGRQLCCDTTGGLWGDLGAPRCAPGTSLISDRWHEDDPAPCSVPSRSLQSRYGSGGVCATTASRRLRGIRLWGSQGSDGGEPLCTVKSTAGQMGLPPAGLLNQPSDSSSTMSANSPAEPGAYRVVSVRSDWSKRA